MDVEKISTALVVDDNPLIIMFVSEIIEESGFSVLTARSGEEAINILEVQGSSTTLLFSDIKMPGAIDGVMLAHVVAKRWPHINMILSSGHSRDEFQDILENASFLEKPFTRDSLISLLSRQRP